MCGISALFALQSVSVSPFVRPMTEVIRHRGPDDEGYALVTEIKSHSLFLGGDETCSFVYGTDLPYAPSSPATPWPNESCRVAMGHRRLSILDLSPAGHQPMCTRDGRYLLVYNGEIYNHLELREELVFKGASFYSNSDTEVVLAAYNAWGPDCLDRFVGMFAFVIYDTMEKSIFVARDRFGVKPLYYWFSPEGFLAFASEIKQFTVLPGWKARLNGPKAYDFLARRLADHTSETLFADVRQLQGGEFVQSSLAGITSSLPVVKWYKPKLQEIPLKFEDAKNRFKELLYNSISLHQRADVPVGTGLSGGLDSSSIVCIVNELLKGKGTPALQNTFSSCSHIAAYDERPFIQEVVRKTKVKAHYTFPPIEELFNSLGKILWHHDEPIPATSVYAEWHVFKLVSNTSVKVTLEGHGADELLAGYPVFFKAQLSHMLANGNWMEFLRECQAIRKVHGSDPNFSLINGLKKIFPLLFSKSSNDFRFYSLNIPLLLGKGIKSPPYDPMTKRTVNELSYEQLFYTSLPAQLHWADRDSMANSIECRVPYLDHRLVEFVLSCPAEYKIKNGITKRLLRKALGDKLPAKVAQRTDKMGYVTPEKIWAKQEAPEEFMQAVERSVEQSKGYLKSSTISTAARIIKGNIPYDPFIWRIISFGSWMDKFFVK